MIEQSIYFVKVSFYLKDHETNTMSDLDVKVELRRISCN